MADTPRLHLPLLEEAQASPEIPVNIGAYKIDALLQGGIVRRDLGTPPVSPNEGEAYVVAAPGTGAWAGKEDQLAAFQGGGWRFYPPQNGWRLWVESEGITIRYGVGSPSTWVEDTGSDITVGTPGSPTLFIPGVTTLIFDNATVEESGAGAVTITPGAGTLEVDDIDNALAVPGVAVLEFAGAVVSMPAAGTARVTITGGGGGGSGLENQNADTHPYNASAMDDEFEEQTLNTGIWTWFAQGGSSVGLALGCLQMVSPVEATATLRGIEQPHTGPAVYRIKCTGVSPANFNLGAIGFRNSGNGRMLTFSGHRVGPTISADRWTNNTTFSAGAASATARGNYTQPGDTGWLYLELEDDGTNLIGRVSFTGLPGMWTQIFSETRATFLGTPDQVGLYQLSQSASVGYFYVDFFRRMSP